MIITIPGQPRGWRQNHTGRAVGRGPNAKVIVTSYLVENAAKWQKDAVHLIRRAWGSTPTMDCALSLRVEAVWARPGYMECSHKRKPCSCAPEHLAGVSLPYLGVPDLTNVYKLAEDALVKAGVIEDDRLVCESSGVARYAARGEEAHVEITIQHWAEMAGEGTR